MDEVFRRIVASGVPLDQVEVVCASSAYPMLVAEKAALLEWRATVSDGMPASATRPGRLLLRFCDWVAGGFVAADLRRLLQSGDCAPQTFDQGAAPLSAAQAARLLLKSQATWGRHVYTPALTRLVQRYDRRAADTEASEEIRAWNTGKATAVRTLIEWIEEILDSVPREDSAIGDEPRRNETGAGVPLAALVDSATAFVARNAGRASALDAIASVRLTDALAELHTLGDYRCEISAAVRFIRERVESLVVGRDRPRPGHLHISSLAAAGFDGRRLVFIVGLQEGGVFPSPVEDAVLLDDERAKISAMLRTSLERQDQVVSMALSRLAAIRHSSEQLCLSFSSRDTREFRDTFPSWIVLQAFRRISGNPASSYDDLSKWLGEPVSAVPASPGAGVTEGQWWLAQAKSNRHAKAAILETYPALASGIEAEAARDSDLFTKFDGYVPEAGAALDPGRTGRAISATSLESAAKCPLRFFFQNGLGISVIEEGRVDEDGWLDPLLRGSELHDLFAAIMRVVRHEKRKPDPNADKARLREMGTKRLEELRDAMPPPSDEVFARQSAEFLDDLDAFIEAECAGKHGGAPVGFEVSFGFALDEDEADGPREPLASEEPALIELGDGRRIVLHGRIDRINRIEPAKYEVVDYKTGGYWPNDWKGEFAGGTRLQHALYGVAATALLKKRDPKAQVVRGVYLFPAVKGRGHRKVIPAPSRARLVAVLRDLTDVIGKGAFAAADGPDGCKWCDFKAACHAEAGERSQAKVENPANAMLQPYRDLRGNHE